MRRNRVWTTIKPIGGGFDHFTGVAMPTATNSCNVKTGVPSARSLSNAFAGALAAMFLPSSGASGWPQGLSWSLLGGASSSGCGADFVAQPFPSQQTSIRHSQNKAKPEQKHGCIKGVMVSVRMAMMFAYNIMRGFYTRSLLREQQ